MSIITTQDVNSSLRCMGIKLQTTKKRNNFSNDDYKEIIKMKKSKTWKEIENIVGIDGNTLSALVSVYKRKYMN